MGYNLLFDGNRSWSEPAGLEASQILCGETHQPYKQLPFSVPMYGWHKKTSTVSSRLYSENRISKILSLWCGPPLPKGKQRLVGNLQIHGEHEDPNTNSGFVFIAAHFKTAPSGKILNHGLGGLHLTDKASLCVQMCIPALAFAAPT